MLQQDQSGKIRLCTPAKIAIVVITAGVLTAGIMKTVGYFNKKKTEREAAAKAHGLCAELQKIQAEVRGIREKILDAERIERGEEIMENILSKDTDVYKCCVRMLSHPDTDARVVALLYIGFSGGHDAVAHVSARLRSDKVPLVRYTAAMVLGRMAAQEREEGYGNDYGLRGSSGRFDGAADAFMEIEDEMLFNEREDLDEQWRFKMLYDGEERGSPEFSVEEGP